MRKMKITLRKDGTQKVEVLGGTGQDCVEFTRELEQRLGMQLGERELKPEFHETEQESQHDREYE